MKVEVTFGAQEKLVTGQLVIYEEELMVIEFPDGVSVRAGEYAECSLQGRSVPGRVICAHPHRVHLFVPHANAGLHEYRRKLRRIGTQLRGFIMIGEDMHAVLISDISEAGVGFIAESPISADKDAIPLVFHTDFFSIVLRIRMLHAAQSPEGYRYGARIELSSREQSARLRSYLLMTQLLSEG
ncbi:PilZ domain-containing protein [Paenibacillus sp. YYML68]|uniref:PilZ domain-containing protein n=1 Tax=Paenibacillus sp. YYML68 TaxID=2909250 RepID=UPI00248F64D7|nr:PilZ domain-containing protein [Paenibacillus sp. YYML68]